MTSAAPDPPNATPRRCRFTRNLRVLRKADFERAMNAGVRSIDERLICWVVANGLPHPRIGLVVGRRQGGAVQRNRLKRLLREAFRTTQHDLPPGVDLICSPKVGVRLDLAGARDSLRRLAERAVRRLNSAGP